MAAQTSGEFRRYLEESGAVDVISSALAALYEEAEKPKNVADFLKSHLGAPTSEDYAKLEAERRDLVERLEAAHSRIAELENVHTPTMHYKIGHEQDGAAEAAEPEEN